MSPSATVSKRLADGVRRNARTACDTEQNENDPIGTELRIVRCRNGFVVEVPHESSVDARCVVTSLEELLDIVRTEFGQ